MSSPVVPKLFFDNGNSSRTYENFQHFLFKDINLSNSSSPISFYRGDFRGVTMDRMKFWKNNFDRADFVNAYITDSEFEGCYFGTDFTNVIFERVKFVGNHQDTCAFYNCIFRDCLFDKEKISQTTMRDCEYDHCVIRDCIFEQNALDDLVFSHSIISNVSLADMGALNFAFDDCTFEKVVFDPDYCGSYLIKKCSLQGITFEYRGSEFAISDNIGENYRALSLFYLQEKRYHEAFNSLILYNDIARTNVSVIPFFEQILGAITTEKHFINRNEQFLRCLKIVTFYADSRELIATDSIRIIGLLKAIDRSIFRLKDLLEFENVLSVAEEALQQLLLSAKLWDSLDMFSMCAAEIKIDDENFGEFEQSFEAYVDLLFSELGISTDDKLFEIIEVRKGSLVISLVSYAVAIWGLAKILRATASEIYSIKLEAEIKKQTIKLISERNSRGLKSLKGNSALARKIINEPSNELLRKSNKLSELFKSFKIFPNTPFDSGNSTGPIQ